MVKNQIQLFQEYRIYSDFSVRGRWKEEHFFYIEAAFTWCLLYQKNHLKGDNAYHQRLWFLFGLDNRIDLVDDEPSADEESAPAEEMAEDAIDEMDTTGNHKKMKQDSLERLEIEQRIVRNCTHQQFLEDLKSPEKNIPSLPQNLAIGPVSHLEILNHIIKTAVKEIKNFTGLVKELGVGRITEILQKGLNPAVPTICQNRMFSLEVQGARTAF